MMKMRPALLVIGACTVFVGLTNLSTSALQERVSTCETQLNNAQLQLIGHLQQMGSNENKIIQHVLSRQIELATGVPGPPSEPIAKLAESAIRTGKTAMDITKQMEVLISTTCDEERSVWIGFSLLTVLVNSLIASLAFWLGLRVVDNKIAEAADAEDASAA